MPAASSPALPVVGPQSAAPCEFGFLSARIRSSSSSPGVDGGMRKSTLADPEVRGKARQHEQVLVRHLGRGQDPDLLGPVAPSASASLAMTSSHVVSEARSPSRTRGHGEAAVIIDPAEAVPAGIADPPPVDVLIEARLDARNAAALIVVRPVAVRVDLDVATPGAARADGLVVSRYHTRTWNRKSRSVRAPTGQMSITLPEYLFSSVAPGNRPISEWSPRLKMPQLARSRDLVTESHAARAEDAAFGVEDDVRPERHRLGLVHLLVGHPRVVEAVLHVVDLQPALARLIAHRTVERVVDQVELHDGLARLEHPLGLRVDDHAVGGAMLQLIWGRGTFSMSTMQSRHWPAMLSPGW